MADKTRLVVPPGRRVVQSLARSARSPLLPAQAAATPDSEAGRAISRTIWARGDSTSQRMPPSSRTNNLTARSDMWQERARKGQSLRLQNSEAAASRHASSRFSRRFLRDAVSRSCCGEVRVMRGELYLAQRRWTSPIHLH